MDEWSESCGVTGLELRKGDPVRVVLLDKDYAEKPGPCAAYGLWTIPLAAVYDGEGGYQVDVSEPQNDADFDVFCSMGDVRRPSNNLLVAGLLRGDRHFWVMAQAVYEFLPELPLQTQEQECDTVGALAKLYASTIREAVMPHVASEVADNAGDSSEAEGAFHDNQAECPGMADITDQLGDAQVADSKAMDGFIASWVDMFTLWRAMRETRKMFVPSVNVGLQYEGHKAVSELARFTRRKAIAAGFVSAA